MPHRYTIEHRKPAANETATCDYDRPHAGPCRRQRTREGYARRGRWGTQWSTEPFPRVAL